MSEKNQSEDNLSENNGLKATGLIRTDRIGGFPDRPVKEIFPPIFFEPVVRMISEFQGVLAAFISFHFKERDRIEIVFFSVLCSVAFVFIDVFIFA